MILRVASRSITVKYSENHATLHEAKTDPYFYSFFLFIREVMFIKDSLHYLMRFEPNWKEILQYIIVDRNGIDYFILRFLVRSLQKLQ